MKRLLTVLMLSSLFASAGWANDYVKVTTSDNLTSGTYLIVYEEGNIAFNGGLSTLDAVSNYISVTINSNKIESNSTVDAAAFTYDANAKTLKSASGYYIGQTEDNNGLKQNATNGYTNEISLDNSGNANIVSSSAYLRYNSSSNQTRFRYFKSSTYTNQKAIQLYKLQTTPTVTGIANFKKVDSGTTVLLYLPDSNNARVTHVESNSNGTVDAYVRDDTGAMRMTGISPNRAMAYDQHLAGWITGKYTIGSDGIPQFEPVDGLTNTDQLVIADRVTEAITEPVAINAGDIGSNLANWVTISEMEVTNTNVDNNKFDLAYQDQVYNGAIVDISAIAANGKLYPVDDLNHAPITFVVDAEKNFTSPSASIDNVNVRLKRSLSASHWNFLTVPFDIDEFDGDVMYYSGVELGTVGSYVYNGNTYDIPGGVMKFDYGDGSIQAGVPYLVKPNTSVRSDQTFNSVTLSSTQASTVTKNLSTSQNAMGIGLMAETPVWVGDYSLVGSYNPMTLDPDEATVLLTGNDNISWTSLLDDTDIAGTEAYITIPSGAGAALDLGTSQPVITAITTLAMHQEQPANHAIYNLMGQRLTRPLSQLPPGIYIVNGKKIVKR